jgi:hypothetical protein
MRTNSSVVEEAASVRDGRTYFRDKSALSALLVYLALMAIVYGPVVFSGKTLVSSSYTPHGMIDAWQYGYDGRNAMHNLSIDLATASYFEYPLNRLVGDELLDLRPPLWNPYQAAGTPLAAQYSTRAFFPYQMLEDIAPAWLSDFFLLGRLLVAGFFTFIFLRLVGLGFAPGLTGGALYMFSGTFTWFINLEQMVNVAMVAPVLLMCLEMLAARGRQRDVVLSAVAFALVLLGGQPETALYVLLLGGAYYLARLSTEPKCPGRENLFKAIKKIAAAFVIGFLLASPLIVPFVELWANSHHLHPVGGDMGVRDPNPIERAINIFTPTFNERPLNPVYSHHPFGVTLDRFGKVNYSKIFPNNGEWDYLGGYTGMAAFYLALMGFIGALMRRRKGALRGLTVFFFIFGAWVLLKNFGVRPFLWLGYLPLFDQVWSQRWAGPVWTLSLAVSAAMGIELFSRASQANVADERGGVEPASWPRLKARYAEKREFLLGAFTHSLLYWFSLNAAVVAYGFLHEKIAGAQVPALRVFVMKTLYLPCFAIFFAIMVVTLRKHEFRRPSLKGYAALLIVHSLVLNALIVALGMSSIETDALTRIGGADVYAVLNGATLILILLVFAWSGIEAWSSKYERPYSEAVFAFVALMLLYAFVVTRIVRFSVLKVPELRDYYIPSIVIGEGMSVFFLIAALALCLYVIRTGKGLYGLLALSMLELWHAVPRLYEHGFLYYKLALVAIGLAAIILFLIERPRPAMAVVFVFFASFLYLDAKAEYGFPERYDPFSEPPYVEFLKDKQREGDYGRVMGNHGVLFPNFASAARLQDVRFINSLAVGSFQDFRIAFLHEKRVSKETSAALWFTGRPELHIVNERGGIDNKDVPPEGDLLSRLEYYSLLGVKYVLMPEDSKAVLPGFPLVYDKEIKIYENPSAFERVFFPKSAVKADNLDEVWWTIENKVSDLRSMMVVEKDLPEGLFAVDAAARITGYGPDRVVVEAESSGRAMLVLTDVFYPGWEALVNGERGEIYRVDGIFRGVMLEAGKHTVEFVYRPLSFRIGVALCLIAVAGMAVLLYLDRKEKQEVA